jgi:hypothetical protein
MSKPIPPVCDALRLYDAVLQVVNMTVIYDPLTIGHALDWLSEEVDIFLPEEARAVHVIRATLYNLCKQVQGTPPPLGNPDFGEAPWRT